MPALRAKDFTPGVPVDLAFLSLDPKEAPDNGYGSAMVFRSSVGSIYLAPDPARDILEQLAQMSVRPNEPIRIVKIATSHGGSRWKVLRPADLQQQLEASVAHVQGTHARSAREVLAEANAAQRPIRVAPSHPSQSYTRPQRERADAAVTAPALEQIHLNSRPPESSATARMCGAMMAAIDAALETQTYAARKGLSVTFSEESIRCMGLSIYIGMQREGGR